jgi:hypothetical protein
MAKHMIFQSSLHARHRIIFLVYSRSTTENQLPFMPPMVVAHLLPIHLHQWNILVFCGPLTFSRRHPSLIDLHMGSPIGA